LNICIDVREVFSIKIVRELAWSSLSTDSQQTEMLTVPKTSSLSDIQAALEKNFGLDGSNFRVWWRSYNEQDNGLFREVPADMDIPVWEKTDNFVPAIPTAFEQEPELTLYIEECDSDQIHMVKEELPHILVFLKLYDPVSRELVDAGKIYPLCYNDPESPTFQSGRGFKNLVLHNAKLQDCAAIYLLNRKTDSVEKLVFDVDKTDGQPERDIAGENGDICIVELIPEESNEIEARISFDEFYDTLRNTRDILVKSKTETDDYPSEFQLTFTLSTNYSALKHQIKQHLLANGRIGPNGERLSVECVELFQCYWSALSGLSPRSAEFPVDHHFDGNLEDLLKSGNKEEPIIYFKAVTRMVAPSMEPVEPEEISPEREVETSENSVDEGAAGGILVGGIVEGKSILMENTEDDEESEEPDRKKGRFLDMSND